MFKIIDKFINEIDRHFEKKSPKNLIKLECLLLVDYNMIKLYDFFNNQDT